MLQTISFLQKQLLTICKSEQKRLLEEEEIGKKVEGNQSSLPVTDLATSNTYRPLKPLDTFSASV